MFVETAVNIGYSCKLLTEEMAEVYVVDADSFEDVENQLNEFKKDIARRLEAADTSTHGFTNHGFTGADNTNRPKSQNEKIDPRRFAIILNGHSLVCSISLYHAYHLF